MSRSQGSKNKQAIAVPDTVLFTTDERIEFIASLIVNRIIEDETNGFSLLKEIGVGYESEQSTS
jgi:hypothetical protein